IVLGRSDDTLNPGGVRIGAAEVTLAAERVPEVIESMAVAKRVGDDEQIMLFVILKSEIKLSLDIVSRINQEMPSPRHKPKDIFQVNDFPTTLSGKRSIKTVRE